MLLDKIEAIVIYIVRDNLDNDIDNDELELLEDETLKLELLNAKDEIDNLLLLDTKELLLLDNNKILLNEIDIVIQLANDKAKDNIKDKELKLLKLERLLEIDKLIELLTNDKELLLNEEILLNEINVVTQLTELLDREDTKDEIEEEELELLNNERLKLELLDANELLLLLYNNEELLLKEELLNNKVEVVICLPIILRTNRVDSFKSPI